MNIRPLIAIRNVALSAALAVGTLAPTLAHAEDIEVYVGQGGGLGGVQPNILFIIDTSGSMNEVVSSTQEPYDPSIDYDGDCSNSRVYFDDDSSYPDCDDTDQYVDIGKFYCNAATTAFTTVGYYQDRFGQWENKSGTSNDKWRSAAGGRNTRETECKSDSGVHGNGGSAKYAANQSNGPWNTNSAQSIDWNTLTVQTFMSGNYLNWWHNPPSTVTTRIQLVKQATVDLVDSIGGVNIALMRFSSDADGGMIVYPMGDVATNRTAFKTAVNALPANSNTPLSETMYEAGLYWRGAAVDFGLDSLCSSGTSCPSVSTVRGNKDNDLADAGDNTYASPIEYQCQKNFTVYLTDGAPTSDVAAGAKIQAQPGYSGIGTCSTTTSGDCLDEAASYLYNRDIISGLNGTQNVITYTVGMNIDHPLLAATASKGGGKYYSVNDAQELVTAFTTIISEILAINTTFTAPAVSVNAFNRTVHLNQLYFTIFKPSEFPHWDGNVKRFDLAKVDGEIEIVDQNGALAVDDATGFFDEDATSLWTSSADAPDGGEAAIGGAAGELTATRNVYTYLGNADLNATANLVQGTNTGITKAMLGDASMTDTERTTLIDWLKGIDVNDDDDDGSTTDARRIMGDPLHSKPVVVTYGGTTAAPDLTIFFTTNDGYLHAIDADDGSEIFSFIPPETMVNATDLFENLGSLGHKVYGLDGAITPWVNDADKDGIIEPLNGDFVRIVFGQRRGGNHYWALDVTDRTNPQFMWQITGGTGDFAEMGQTWSDPVLGKVKVGSSVKDVLVFGGGYDPDQDDNTLYAADDIGRAIYIVDASTGARIWWAGPTGSGANLVLDDLKNSIPSAVRAVDMNNDGRLDRMYVGDMGGRLFRFDILNGNAAASLVSGGKIASLGAGDMATPTVVESRRFYYAPDVAVVVDKSLGSYLHVGIGSGYREHPTDDDVKDRFFALRDNNIYNVPADYAYGFTASTMYDATDNVLGEGTEEEVETAFETLKSADGWYIDLVKSDGTLEGEKVLAEARTIDNKVVFTTFTPVAAAASTACAPSQGVAKLYVMSIAQALPIRDYNQTGGELTAADRAHTLTRGGIPPEITVLYPELDPSSPVSLVGPEKVDLDLTNTPIRTYWNQEDSDTGN